MTFSIAAYDPQEKTWGIAVQSKLLAVGALVPWARAGVGVVATQSIIERSFGRDGLALLAESTSAEETIDRLLAPDELRQLRQMAVIDKTGRAAAYTGKGCLAWAGDIVGEHYAIQGNRLVDEDTLLAMEKTFLGSPGSLASRLLASLAAGQGAGGDRAGQQAAALLVVGTAEGDGGNGSRIDLRVDDDTDPITQLIHLYDKYALSFLRAKEDRVVPIKGDIKKQLSTVLQKEGILRGSETDATAIARALATYIDQNNFHARAQGPGMVDLDILAYMQNRNTNHPKP